MANAFACGDKVVLKSGGPPMTVDKQPDPLRDFYVCVWFKGASKEVGHFSEHLLETYVAPAKP